MINLFHRYDIQPTLRVVVCLLVLLTLAVNGSAQEKSTIQASFANNQAPVKIDVLVGQSRVIEFDQDYERLSISDPKIAEVVPINYKQALINGLTFGQVNLVAWAKRKDPTDAERLVVFDIYVQVNLSLIDNQIKILFPKENIQLSQANNSVVLSGSVTKPELADQVQKIIEAAGLKVTNLLKGPITDVAQVQLQVRVAEVNRQILREVSTAFGFSNEHLPTYIDAAGPASPTSTFDITQNMFKLLAGSTPGANLIFGNVNDKNSPVAFLRALHQRGAIRSLAEPNLIALHGQKASFLAGGEFPIPVIQSVNQGQTAITVLFKAFGVRLDFTPTVVDENHIRLELEPEVSSLDFSSGVTIQGLIIPGLRVRRAKTTLELRDGQSFALAGLIDNQERVNLSKVPLLGDIPIIGELFKSRSFQRNETELLFLATVKLVEPLNPDQLPRLPGVSELKPVGQGPAGTTPAGSIEGQSGHSVPRKAGEQQETQSKIGTDAPSGKKGKAASDSVAGTVGQVSLPAAPVNQTENAPAVQSGVIGPIGSDVPAAKSGKADKPVTKDAQKDPSQHKDVKP